MQTCKFVRQTTDGYYELLPEYRKNMEQFYQNEYYQDDYGNYSQKYSEEEILYFKNLCKEKDFIFSSINKTQSRKKLLDVGCGEGFVLKFFSEFGYEVTGIDFSEYGVRTHNPDVAGKVVKGDIYKTIEKFSKDGVTFDFINVDNVLEHLSDAEFFLKCLKMISDKDTVICIRVPNDFSILQNKLLEQNQIDRCFWVSEKTGEHNYYFNVESLKNFVKHTEGGGIIECYSDFPIDLFLMNGDTNYVMKDGVGHNCYLAKIEFENMLYARSIQNALELHKAYAQNKIGRDISVVFKFENL